MKGKDGEALQGAAVRVLVRVRPFNTKEADTAQRPIVQMTEESTKLADPGHDNKVGNAFGFDKCFWSLDSPAGAAAGASGASAAAAAAAGGPAGAQAASPQNMQVATQEYVYSYIGPQMIRSMWAGYNTCLFAYGQTGSGKTYTMMGEINCAVRRGIIPRLCVDMFEHIKKDKVEQPNLSFRVDASYHEIYNEKVNDLLLRDKDAAGLRVRQHPVSGPFVEGLSSHQVNDVRSIYALLRKGDSERSTASTQLNDHSSRSHAIFTLTITRLEVTSDGAGSIQTKSRKSKVNLVDLAGSERVAVSGVQGERFEEARNINLSLATLGRVIDCLVERTGDRSRHVVLPPYRESILTWLLIDSLGGNSQTFMVATISPSAQNYNETLSTLRYSAKARNIINTATVNKEEESGRLAAELRARIQSLQGRLRQVEQRETRQVEVLEERCGQAEAEADALRDAVSAMEVKLGNKSRMKDEEDRSSRLLKEERAKCRRLEKQVKRLEQQVEVEQFNFEQETRELSQQLRDEQHRHRALQAELDAKEEEVRRLFDEQDRATAERDATFEQLQRMRAERRQESDSREADEEKSHRINVLRKIARDQEEERERAESQAKALRVQLRDAQAEAKALQASLQQAEEQAQRRQADGQAEASRAAAAEAQLQQALREQKGAQAEAQQEVQAMEQRLQRMMSELATYAAEAAQRTAPLPAEPAGAGEASAGHSDAAAAAAAAEAEAEALRATALQAEQRAAEAARLLQVRTERYHEAALEAETETAALRKQLAVTQAERDALEEHARDAEEVVAQLRSTAAELEARPKQAQADTRLLAELSDAIARATAAEAAVSAAEQRCEEAVCKAESAGTAALQGTVARLEGTVCTLQGELRQREEELDSDRADAVTLRKALTLDVERERQVAVSAQQQLDAVQAEKQALRDRISVLQVKCKQAHEDAAAHAQTQASAEKTKGILQATVQELQERLAQAQEAREAEQRKRPPKRSELEEELVRLNRQLREKVQEQGGEIQRLEDELKAHAELEHVSRLFAEQRSDMQTLAKAQSDTEVKAKQLRSTLGEAVEQFAQLNSFKRRMSDDIEERVADLNVVKINASRLMCEASSPQQSESDARRE